MTTEQRPNRWWQWFLLYPGLAIAMVGAVPTYLEAFKSYSLGVPFGRSFDAKEQNRLWQENFDCTKKADFVTITNKKRVEIGSVICESGDVLLRGKRPEWDQPQLRWVSWDEVASRDKNQRKGLALLDFLSSANASNKLLSAQGLGGTVICQKWVGNGMLLQRIATSTGCYDQVINTYNGSIVTSHQAPCNPSC